MGIIAFIAGPVVAKRGQRTVTTPKSLVPVVAEIAMCECCIVMRVRNDF